MNLPEAVINNVALAASGTLNQNITAPANAVAGISHARFRCGTGAVTTPNGFDDNGEVEDYRVAIQGIDLGDNPDSYGTAIANNGARHAVLPGDPLRLGACIDLETDGAPNAGALGDDTSQGQQGGGLCFDDEDGVVLPAVVRACDVNNYSVTASQAGRLDAFIDFNGNGNYTDAGDRIASNTVLVAGLNSLSFTAPCSASAGTTHARFRLSTSGGLPFNGPASDGEVEDYTLGVLGTDFGDAPAPFPTSFAGNGAFHSVNPVTPLFLGECVDTEGDGVPSADARGDDLANSANDVGTCLGTDDEDGIVLPAALLACQTHPAPVFANSVGRLDAWIDFNRDGDWDDAGERLANNTALVAGPNTLSIAVPCAAMPGTTNLRLRLSTTGVASYTGAAIDGEVEDHQVPIFGNDLGDAPAMYGTQHAGNGAFHRIDIDNRIRLGACVDTEGDGAPTGEADGDDTTAGTSTAGTCAVGNDDEDGLTVSTGGILATRLVAGGANDLLVTYTNDTASTPVNLCGYIDFNGDGSFGAGEAASRIVSNNTINGTTNLSFTVPVGAVQATYARFRLSSAACSPTGSMPDGEVEDYVVFIDRYDLGDLPDLGAGTTTNDYLTLRSDNGARHLIVDTLRLGATVDQEFDGDPGLDADGDDAAGPGNDDEDGISFPAGGYELGSPARAFATATNLGAQAATLCGFMDWNTDGDFADVSETASVTVPDGSNATAFTLEFGLAPLSAPANLYARFRLSTSAGCSPGGDAPDGEVEDYLVGTTTNGALSLGNLVFEDLDNNGLRGAGEPGIASVPVRLYADDNQDCIPDGAPLLTTATDGAGDYRFIDLLPGFYAVGILPPTEFLGSTGTGRVWAATGPFEPAPDPDNNTNDDDNGTLSSNEITSCAIELRAKDEPVNDGDADFNSNLTVDFGLVRNFDLALVKRRAANQSNLVTYGQDVNFTITVLNQGTIPASNIVVVDYLPNGLVLNDADWTASAGNEARITIPGPLAAGASIDIPITVQVTPNALAGIPILNVAEIVEATDPVGVVRPDKDSTPDGNGGNDGTPIDDETSNGDNDEDDQDFAGVLVPNTIPTLDHFGLLILLTLLTLLAHRKMRQ
ncbi:MAG: DUF11 domain-containing protein [Ahniella sp.]|nr:DUF11 domain-containing protein [Ahniella sp.]